MPAKSTLPESVERDGFAICEDTLSSDTVAELCAALQQIDEENSVRKRSGVFAVRSLLSAAACIRELADSLQVRKIVEAILGPDAFPVSGILFDKIPDANWKVPWHQDVTIAVQQRVEAEGFGPWSMKAGVLHVQPPAYVLENMISVRLHLDKCGEDNGALRVIAGSHKHGRIAEEQIASFTGSSPEVVCAVGLGGALVMRPLLLHASSSSRLPGHRRVIHLDFASVPLPGGMQWSGKVD